MLDFPLNKLQILSLTAFIFSDLNYKIVVPLNIFFEKKSLYIYICVCVCVCTVSGLHKFSKNLGSISKSRW
jgi:hypothetical protein